MLCALLFFDLKKNRDDLTNTLALTRHQDHKL